jgi:hypothetical protein
VVLDNEMDEVLKIREAVVDNWQFMSFVSELSKSRSIGDDFDLFGIQKFDNFENVSKIGNSQSLEAPGMMWHDDIT